MPNEKRHALRYLLLRYLRMARDKVPSDVYREIVKTLSVDQTRNGFRVRWTRGGLPLSKEYAPNEFKFYVRGDRAEDKQSQLDHSTNDQLARTFVEEALGIRELNLKLPLEPLFPKIGIDLLIYVSICAALIYAGGVSFIQPGVILFSLFTVEFAYPLGKVLVPFLTLALVQSGFLFSGMLTSLFYLIFQGLDPDRKLRRIRFLLGLLVFGYALFEVVSGRFFPRASFWIVISLAAAISIFLARWTLGSHFRSFPLIFPFFCFGLHLDGYGQLAALGFVCASAEAFLAHARYRLFPIQREHSLPANG